MTRSGSSRCSSCPIELVSTDPLTGGEIWVHLDPGDGAWWEPQTAGSSRGGGPSFRGCCRVLNFFDSGESALRYLVAHPDVAAHAISLPEAIEAGRAIFGDVLR